jgi:hypothetical protein
MVPRHREGEEDMLGIPISAKTVTMLVERVGFPVLAFMMMFYLCFSSLDKMTHALDTSTKALVEFQTATREFQAQVKIDHDAVRVDCATIKANQEVIKGKIEVLATTRGG